MSRGILSLLGAAAVCACGLAAAAQVNIGTVPVGDPGNAGELSGQGAGGSGPDRVCGAVDYTYNIGRYEVTAEQYMLFLNAVAATDTHGLFNSAMSDYWEGCGIQRGGSSGTYTYSMRVGFANYPVTSVSYWDACRFTNWLHNGQPTGAQDAGTTETGAYTLNGYNGSGGLTIQRNPDWKWAVTSEDEWYKAAYYNPSTSSYYDYPTSSNSISHAMANYDNGGRPINVDAYPYPSPYGTYGQGGNVWEWDESVVGSNPHRGWRGGSFFSAGYSLHAWYRGSYYSPTTESRYTGFRVSEVPEPSSILMLALAGAGIFRRR